MTRRRLLCWLLACFVVVSQRTSAGWAAPPEVSLDADLNISEVVVGQQVELTVTARIVGDPSGITAPGLEIKPIPGLTPMQDSMISQSLSAQGYVGTQRFYFRADKPGEYHVGPVEFSYRVDGEPTLLRDAGPTLLVQAPGAIQPPPTQPDVGGQVPANPGQALTQADSEEGLRDIKGVFEAPFNFGIAFIVLAILILLALAALLYYLLRKRPQPVPAPIRFIEPPVGLLQRTLQRLDAIPMPPDLTDDQAVADYYLAITDLTKEYLAERYGIDARERTSWELRQDYRAVVGQQRPDALGEFLRAYQEVFELCDGGKYAHLHGTYPLMEEAKRRGRAFFETDNRLAGGGAVPIGVAANGVHPGMPHMPDEPGLQGAASGMRIKAVRRGESPEMPTAKKGARDLPRATRLAMDAVQSPSTSSTLFTAADSTSLVNRLTGAESPESESPPPAVG